VTQDRANPNGDGQKVPYQKAMGSNHYTLLGLHPSASVQEIRHTYREMSKLYHPDTTQLPPAIATQKFQQLNEAYATLCNPDRRSAYDLKIGYSRVIVVQPLPSLNRPQPRYTDSAYIDATDRPLSPGEIFALFILGITFVGCLVLAITIGFTRGEAAFQPLTAQEPIVQETLQPTREFVSPKTPEISISSDSVP
jgi:DnaJ-domain-containing protein 1